MAIFEQTFTVNPEHIDDNNHLNNVVYIQWMQDVAIMHSSTLGWDAKKYATNQCSWVAKTHFVDYIRPAFLRETLTVKTWIDNIKRCSSVRKYAFYNSESKLIAKAETLWIFINAKTGRPQGIFPEIKENFIPIDNVL